MSYAPILDPQGYQARQDKEHLNLLAIFHYIMGALTILGGCFFLLYVLVGAFAMGSAGSGRPGAGEPPPAFLGGFIMGFGVIGTLLCWGIGGLTVAAGRCLAQHKGQTLIYVIAGLNCLHAPLGTALGVCTFIVMSRPTVKALFDPQFAMAMGTSNPASPPTNNPPWYRG